MLWDYQQVPLTRVAHWNKSGWPWPRGKKAAFDPLSLTEKAGEALKNVNFCACIPVKTC
jgi:hypothetical protein